MNDVDARLTAPAPAPPAGTGKSRPLLPLEVIRRERVSASMVRVIAGADNMAAFDGNDFTDKYVKILFFPEGVHYDGSPDLGTLREGLPREKWPVTRTYTVRWVNLHTGQLAIDFVIHGDKGLAGPWAAAVEPGDPMLVTSPGGSYRPDPAADWHLFAGDDAALPAVAAAIEALPSHAAGHAYLEVDGEADLQELAAPEGVEVTWLLREGVGAGRSNLLVGAVAGAAMPEDAVVQAFVHGERGYMKALRDVLLKERGLDRSRLSLSGYWALGRVEDDFQAEKKLPIGKIL